MLFGLFSTKQTKPDTVSPLKLKIFMAVAAVMIVCAGILAIVGAGS